MQFLELMNKIGADNFIDNILSMSIVGEAWIYFEENDLSGVGYSLYSF